MNILITGGAGYIGSHTAVQAITAGHKVVILDNLLNSCSVAIDRIKEITGIRPTFITGDIRDSKLLDTIFTENEIDVVIHFAGLKAVGESHTKPLAYYDTNVNGTIQLTNTMNKHGIKKLIFSSSATVYGENAPVPYVETLKRGTSSSPYGSSKAMAEQILEDLSSSDTSWSIVLLRYFNPIGAHPSGLIGEDPKGQPNNLMPFISQVAVGRQDKLSIFGIDHPTSDGTCERDFLHVMDLADGHLCALGAVENHGCHIYNLGTGKPTSVWAILKAFEETNNVVIPFQTALRRVGDLPSFWADTNKAARELGWNAKRDLNEMMRDTWIWQRQNPDGYGKQTKL